jgi:hypothetical protein
MGGLLEREKDEWADGRHETIAARERIVAVLRALAANRCRGFARGVGGVRVGLSVVDFDEDAEELVVSFEGGAEQRSPLFLEIEGYSAMYWIPATRARGSASACRVTQPASIVRARDRALARGKATGMSVRFRHPLMPTQLVERAVRDLSGRGLSFWTDPDEDALSEGLVLREIEVVYANGARVNLTAEVRNLVEVDGRVSCGLRIAPDSVSGRSEWSRLVDTAVHLRTARAQAASSL